MGGCHISPGAGTVTVCLQPHLDVLTLEGEASLLGDDRVLEEVQGNRTAEREVELLVVEVRDYHGFGGSGREFGLVVKSVKSGVLLLKTSVLLRQALDLSRLLPQRLHLRVLDVVAHVDPVLLLPDLFLGLREQKLEFRG